MEEVVARKKYGWVGVILGVVGVVFILLSIYLILYAPFLTNSKYLIPVRKDFYEKVLDKILLPGYLPYQAYVQEVSTGEDGETWYTYAIMGRFVLLDADGPLLIIRDMTGKAWKMDVTTQTYPAGEGAEYRKLMVVETMIGQDKSETNEIKYHLYNYGDASKAEPYLKQRDMVKILWRDKRRLTEIEELIPLSVVPSGEQWLIPIRKIVGEGE